MKRVSFITSTDSNMGSHRYRIKYPVTLMQTELDVFADIKTWPTGKEDIAVFSKHFNLLDYSYAMHVKACGGKVIFDVCDFHYDNPPFWEHYLRMFAIADVVTFSSSGLQDEVLKVTVLNKPHLVISDPPLTKRKEPKATKPSEHPNMLWYGQGPSMNPLMDHIENFPRGNLTILCDRFPEWLDKYPGHIKPVNWSEEALEQCLEECDVVVIPQQLDPKSKAKSCNRLVEAVNSGRQVVASPITSYKPFEGKLFIGQDIGALLIDYLATPYDVCLDRLLEARKLMDTLYSPDTVRSQWMQAIELAS